MARRRAERSSSSGISTCIPATKAASASAGSPDSRCASTSSSALRTRRERRAAALRPQGLRRERRRGLFATRDEIRADEQDRERQVEDVVGTVHGYEVRVVVTADEEAVDEEGRVDDRPAEEIRAGALVRPREQDADPEQEVSDVVKNTHLEDAEQLRVRVLSGEGHVVVVRRDSGDEAEDPDHEENDSQEQRQVLCERPIPIHGALQSGE